ncbi:PmoA family protein [Kibdelosporangium persicum]|uniref:Methane oxygenase PmoA n=1 Tax=Kibdelosporangium persicum TaxID=2698649 RepID=A0ABX2F6U2_9PSEU|nr:PmoA family protein [Kibdelosporangium persicum]NRN67069.1 Methane oxygenase PmoA [Kibdelosporangium persicum]
MGDLMRLIADNGYVRVAAGDVELAEYVVEPGVPQSDSPKPYLHPLRTTTGDVVSAIRPHDHTWHNGLQFTAANLSGENFWGGRTFVRGQGYTPLDNNGSIRHVRWHRAECADDRVELGHRLEWQTRAGECWLIEDRSIEVAEVDPVDGSWLLTWRTRLHNTSGRELRWGSPVTEGRPTAGYGGLFWRGPRSFIGGEAVTSSGVHGEEAMGSRSSWLSFTGQHDVSLRHSTVVFVDCPDNVRYPTPWYVRTAPFPVVSFAVTFHEPLLLEPDGRLSLTHHAIIADGRWDSGRIDEYIGHRITPRWSKEEA